MSDPVVQTRAGSLRGFWRDGSAAFLGVPYARPPVGDLTFAPPQPVRPWAGVRDALTFGPTAQLAQHDAVTTIPEPSTPGDDVLNLCVYTPVPGRPDAALPVLVWIHGGGYTAGCQNSPWYDGAAFNRDGVVTVAIGYRLGVEGWLHVEGAPDNRGALDWLAALAWVRDNVAAFGGDPARVTVAGQSAGGGAVLALLAMPRAAGLFRRAVAMSPGIGRPRSVADAARVSARFTALSGLPARADALQDVPKETVHEAMLRSTARDDGLLELAVAPFPDGDLLPGPIDEAAAHGLGCDVPLVVGSTRHEFDLAAPRVPPDLPAPALRDLLTALGLGAPAAEELVAAHRGPAGALVGRALTDALIRRVAVGAAESRAAAGAAPTWLYEFAWPSRAPANRGLAFHCVDLPFAWDCLGAVAVEAATGPNPPQALADAMHGALVAFVAGDDPPWPAYAPPQRTAMVWDDAPRVASDPLREVRERWLAP